MSEVEVNILFFRQNEKFPDRGNSVPKVGQGWGTVLNASRQATMYPCWLSGLDT